VKFRTAERSAHGSFRAVSPAPTCCRLQSDLVRCLVTEPSRWPIPDRHSEDLFLASASKGLIVSQRSAIGTVDGRQNAFIMPS